MDIWSVGVQGETWDTLISMVVYGWEYRIWGCIEGYGIYMPDFTWWGINDGISIFSLAFLRVAIPQRKTTTTQVKIIQNCPHKKTQNYTSKRIHWKSVNY